MSFSYINLQRSAVPGRLGGWAHICGVVDALRKDGEVKVVSYMARDVAENRRGAISVDIPKNLYYLHIAKFVWREKASESFVFRKTLLGMYIVFFVVLAKKMIGSKQLFFMEFNGISGDFVIENSFFKRILLYSNLFPLFVFDGVYCVNENIRQRIVSSRIICANKVFVCKNGGANVFDNIRKAVRLDGYEGVDIYYYGADRPFYHLSKIIGCVVAVNEAAAISAVRLHLVGPNLDSFSGPNVFVHGAADEAQFASMIISSRGMAWGIIPLNDLGGRRDIEPIKTFDYMRMGLPLMHSSYCLEGFDPNEEISRSYDVSNLKQLVSILKTLIVMSGNEYDGVRNEVFSKYSEFLWENRLLELRKRVKNDRY